MTQKYRPACALVLAALLPASIVLAGDWPLHGRTHDEQRFSPLDQVSVDTVDRLGLAWKFATGNTRGMEATPIVIDGIMYVSTAWSRVMALNAVTGELIWHYDPMVPGEKGRDACCDVVNRGVAVSGEQVFLGALDGRLIALNRRTGKVNWSVQTTDSEKPYTITGAPRALKGMVIIGNGGAEFGVRGYFGAYDERTGDLLWRFYTVPSEDASEDEAQPSLELARRTWSPDSLWETGLGGTVWDSFAYDPELDMLYVGVGNASQYNRAQRSPGGGDNLFVSSILAVDPDDGRLIWHYQTTPADAWDYTATQHMILAELDHLGERRRVLMQAPKNGFFYVLDRVTGELLAAENYVPTNWASHVDLETGRPVETDVADWSTQQRVITPAIFGGHNWHPMSYSPDAGLVYIPTIHGIYPLRPDPDYVYDPNTMNTGEDFPALVRDMPSFQPRFCSPTRLTAWDPLEQAVSWEVRFSGGVPAGILSTAGGLVFQGTTDGELVAYAAASGERLWAQTVNVGIMAPPISYSVNGEQYVAVVAGIGGAQGGHGTTLQNKNRGHVLAFKLDGAAEPPELEARQTTVNVDDSLLDPSTIDRGRDLYAIHCVRCHGVGARSSGLIPDLRHSTAEVHEIWSQIVLDGVFSARGMASFADSLDEGDVQAIHSYVISEALSSQSFGRRLMDRIGSAVCIPAQWLAD